MPSEALIQAIAATAELCGKVYSPAAARMLASDLDGYGELSVLTALTRCRKELDGKPFNVAAIIARIDDGHPGVEEAWAMMPMTEAQSVVWTEEMIAAWGVAKRLLDDGDNIGARMAFKEYYGKLVILARDAKRRGVFTVSLGTDKDHRETVLSDAINRGRLTLEYAQRCVPQIETTIQQRPMLSGPTKAGRAALEALKLDFKPKTMPPPEAEDYEN